MLDPTRPALVLAGLGLLLVGLGLWRRRRQTARAAGRAAVPGQVVDEVHGAGGGWVPVVRFTTPDGRQVTGVPRSSSWYGISRVGRRVTVHPDAQDPRVFDATAVGGRAGSTLLLVGPVLLAAGLVGLLAR